MSLTISLKQGDDSVDFDVPTDWSDMTLEYYAGISNVIHSHQEKAQLKENSILERYKDDPTIDEIMGNVKIMDNVRLNSDLFCYMSGLKKEHMYLVDADKIAEVVGLVGILTKEYEPKGHRSFDFEGETYYYPSENLRKNTYGDFIEATQLDMSIESMKNGRFDVLPQQMAILCRRTGEKYDEDLVEEKSEKFKKLTMDKVFEFSFFLTKRNKQLLNLFNMYSEKNLKGLGQ